MAAHPACGLLLDTYHLQRSGSRPRDLEDVAPSEVSYVQYSDVPASAGPGEIMPRLAPGRGVVPFKEWFAAFAAKGYDGYLSYEAPDPGAWARPADEVARDALTATRDVPVARYTRGGHAPLTHRRGNLPFALLCAAVRRVAWRPLRGGRPRRDRPHRR